MLSKKTKYAIKALIHLAKNHGRGPLLIGDIAAAEHIPRKFLEAILLEMKNIGLLGSRKGKAGGYYLAKPPAEIELAKVVRHMNGPIALVPCISLNYYETCEECQDEATCGIRAAMLKVRDATLQVLQNTTLEVLIAEEQRLIALQNHASPA
ncbi:MAG: Rrf2 family transcriptional regulator [Bernardetiaceae bacterium]|jgi:Rrf2 family protein|nr:Rrf2 family transcriptional regulator [Bernardetiaceae bacterium]